MCHKFSTGANYFTPEGGGAPARTTWSSMRLGLPFTWMDQARVQRRDWTAEEWLCLLISAQSCRLFVQPASPPSAVGKLSHGSLTHCAGDSGPLCVHVSVWVYASGLSNIRLIFDYSSIVNKITFKLQGLLFKCVIICVNDINNLFTENLNFYL